MSDKRTVGYTCAYAPLALIVAAGFDPYRILPLGDPPDHAGSLLHDNMCPHVKIVLDRAVSRDVPELAGLVVMNSCDAMRRLSDAWTVARPDVPMVLVDLPDTTDAAAVRWLSDEFERLVSVLEQWAGRPISADDIRTGARRLDKLAHQLAELQGKVRDGQIPGGRSALQTAYNAAVTQPIEHTFDTLGPMFDRPADPERGVPVYVFGNVFAQTEGFDLLAECGARVVGDDLCTGSRQLSPIGLDDGPVLTQLAAATLGRPLCARTMDVDNPGRLADQIVEGARAAGARAVVGHVLKFCDPYIARLPVITATLERAGLPVLMLEGDCTMRSLGQHATRVAAFVEMLEESTPC